MGWGEERTCAYFYTMWFAQILVLYISKVIFQNELINKGSHGLAQWWAVSALMHDKFDCSELKEKKTDSWKLSSDLPTHAMPYVHTCIHRYNKFKSL